MMKIAYHFEIEVYMFNLSPVMDCLFISGFTAVL